MRTVGIVVEYNPFHNGHYYHVQQSRKITGADAVVAVMSGHFLQRGEPALLDKWTRAEMALRGGCDLVLELPAAYSTQSAEWFARGAVATLDATGVVDALCFGSESGDIRSFRAAAQLLREEPASFKQALNDRLAEGVPYPAAYEYALSAHAAEQGIPPLAVAQPNNSLGLHYTLAIERIGSAINPYTIRREKSGYNDQTPSDESIASATAIRKLLLEAGDLDAARPFVPQTTLTLMKRDRDMGRIAADWRLFEKQLLHSIMTRSIEELGEIHEMTEGLEHRLLHTVRQLSEVRFESLLEQLKTKRYTRTKLQRALLAVLLNHKKSDFASNKLAEGPGYIRVLGFTPTGQALLKKMRTSSRWPVLMSAAGALDQLPYLALDIRATAVYALGRGANASSRDLLRDYYEQPIRIGMDATAAAE
ncbi:putative nucleotidyltransferase [Paenibacillus cellulosilyticus]|uniref:tRNA(Met) cytidine acetate ligase n=1 Tax=Paenibacillus cellulosilyticus TaxID=375489 RepID=A0A2V2YXL0_9BACL|nr:nucleotidyltransferase [Paenibacillus cellulosilyticus]PWW06354.1 putative nucleotidyltransferase [Paenibacillus cellulosilyticus]QKS46297.1 nucleotidyltransferase [Paenibacillus cellulosilyticus]